VSVDAHDAEYDLVQSAQRILGKDARSTTGSLESGTSAASLLAYIGGVHAPHPGELPLMLDSEGLPLGWFRLTEYLILPGQSYDIVGTCTDNRSPTDQHDHNLIKKGQKVPTFIITSKTAEEEESTFRRRAMGQMLGGAAISVLMLVIFLAKHGWLFQTSSTQVADWPETAPQPLEPDNQSEWWLACPQISQLPPIPSSRAHHRHNWTQSIRKSQQSDCSDSRKVPEMSLLR
jgi:hypothetical protein